MQDELSFSFKLLNAFNSSLFRFSYISEASCNITSLHRTLEGDYQGIQNLCSTISIDFIRLSLPSDEDINIIRVVWGKCTIPFCQETCYIAFLQTIFLLRARKGWTICTIIAILRSKLTIKFCWFDNFLTNFTECASQSKTVINLEIYDRYSFVTCLKKKINTLW